MDVNARRKKNAFEARAPFKEGRDQQENKENKESNVAKGQKINLGIISIKARSNYPRTNSTKAAKHQISKGISTSQKQFLSPRGLFMKKEGASQQSPYYSKRKRFKNQLEKKSLKQQFLVEESSNSESEEQCEINCEKRKSGPYILGLSHRTHIHQSPKGRTPKEINTTKTQSSINSETKFLKHTIEKNEYTSLRILN